MTSLANVARRRIRKVLVPHIENRGFVGKHPNFQRVEGDRLHLLAIVYDKHGGGFALEFARTTPGPFDAPWGETVPQCELEIGHTPPETRARLVRTTGGSGVYEDFFRFDRRGMDETACGLLIEDAVGKFEQVDEWLRSGKKGENIAAY